MDRDQRLFWLDERLGRLLGRVIFGGISSLEYLCPAGLFLARILALNLYCLLLDVDRRLMGPQYHL